MTEFEEALLARLDRIDGLLQRIARAAEADLREVADNSHASSRGRWGRESERAAQNFATVVEVLIEVGLTRARLKTAEIVAAVADRPQLRQALAAVAQPLSGPPDAVDVQRFGIYLGDHEGECAHRRRLVVDRSNQRRPRWYLVHAEGTGVA
jgi:hypothetical protein